MKKMSHWGKPVALSALLLSVAGILKAPATATSSTTTAKTTQKSEPTLLQRQGNFQVVQNLVGQCRVAKQRIFVYTQRSETSQTLRTLAPDEQVTLADNGVRGWIAISEPEVGYVRAEDLTKCPQAAKPKPTTTTSTTTTTNTTATKLGLCRIVTYKGTEGLAIRERPDKNSPRVGGVYPGNTVTLKQDPPQFVLDKEGRAFVELTAPTSGWLSYGFPNSKSANIGACP